MNKLKELLKDIFSPTVKVYINEKYVGNKIPKKHKKTFTKMFDKFEEMFEEFDKLFDD